jgi:dihydrofolate synthase/folylpolyglutamate synthase
LSLLPPTANYIFTQASTPRSLSALEFKRIAMLKGIDGESYNSVEEAFLSTLKKVKSSDIIFVGGSNFVVADLLSYLSRVNLF